jgi:uncharacterized RDD family membrane protein YckC
MAYQILDEDFQNNRDYPQITFASLGKRIANYLIDIICAYSCIFFVVYLIMSVGSSDESTTLLQESESSSSLESLFTLFIFFLYYFLTESLMKGRTIGKLITGTRAITSKHEYLTAGDALKRTLCRLIPFDGLSFLMSSGYGWHDKWTDTMVVDEKGFQEAYR